MNSVEFLEPARPLLGGYEVDIYSLISSRPNNRRSDWPPSACFANAAFGRKAVAERARCPIPAHQNGADTYGM